MQAALQINMLVSEYQRKLLRSLIPPNVLERMNAKAYEDSSVLESPSSTPMPAAPAGVWCLYLNSMYISRC